MKLKVEVEDYGVMPPFYYGRTHKDWEKSTTIFHIIPINYIIRFGMLIKYKWDVFRSRPSYVDKKIAEAAAWKRLLKTEEIVNKVVDGYRKMEMLNRAIDDIGKNRPE